MTAVGDLSVSLLAAGPQRLLPTLRQRAHRSPRRPGSRHRRHHPGGVPGQVRPARRLKWVWLGVGAAIVMTVAVFLVIQFGTSTISGLGAEAIAGIASLIAVAIVTTMVLWMRKAAASMSGQLRGDMAKALEAGAFAVLSLSFLAVGREGVETALFMVASPRPRRCGR